MTIRELIEELQDIAKRAGDRLGVTVSVDVDDGEGFGTYSVRQDVKSVRYAGGSDVELEVG